MYLVNYLSLLTADARYVAAQRLRLGQPLIGVIDGANLSFTVQPGDKFTHNLSITIEVYCNGLRLTFLDDYTVDESGGPGTGYDTVLLGEAPRPGDLLQVDYLALD